MEAMYDEIVAFSELDNFMDQKLKNYSSGMQVRLAFSIAIKAHNDILIFDEVLAVGDEAFQRKCIDIFEHYKASKQTVILVTHDMETVRQYCSRAMLIDKGKILEIGNPRKVAQVYSRLNQDAIDKGTSNTNDATEAAGPRFLKAAVVGADGKKKVSFEYGQTLTVDVSWSEKLEGMQSLGVNVFKESGEHITGINTRFSKLPKNWQAKGKISLDIAITMKPGKYYVLVEAFREEGRVLDSILEGPKFSVVATDPLEWSGLMQLKHTWR